ncbi:MAG: hypothetical protein Q4A81_04670 [Pasteurellaceae bacterium]|nr:hypothetical protein [Pasteurellaceae bacterium]
MKPLKINQAYYTGQKVDTITLQRLLNIRAKHLKRILGKKNEKPCSLAIENKASEFYAEKKQSNI